MERVMIIGCSGSGKSTLARKLGEKTGLPVVHLDRIWWKPGWVESSREEFDEKLLREIERPRWIMDGNYSRTMPQRFVRCDMVIYLDFNRVKCLWGVIKRVVTNYGKTRPDMGENCPERIDWAFLKWVWNFNKKNRKRNYCWLANLRGKKVIILKNRRHVRKFLESILKDT